MIEVNVALSSVDGGILTGELQAALGNKVIGVSTYVGGVPISIWLADGATQADRDSAANIAAAHSARATAGYYSYKPGVPTKPLTIPESAALPAITISWPPAML